MRPFLKWAGSKKWLVRRGLHIPDRFERYIEPFVGSGAVFFDISPKVAILSDSNSFLMNCYREIKLDWRAVFQHYEALFSRHSADTYYEVRAKLSSKGAEAAGQFLYLNRACFNGIFRVNLEGKFNVPIGSKVSNPFSQRDFIAWSKALEGAELRTGDFEEVIADAGEGDFIFADPPYTVAHNRNGFIEYNEKIFSWDDQVRLASALLKARQRGAKFTITNANHQSVRQLYEPYFAIEDVDRRSAIAGSALKRGLISEIVVRSFDIAPRTML